MLSSVPYIEPYRGFASRSRLIFSCRLLRNRNHIANPTDGFLKNLKNTFQKIVSNEIPRAKVNIEFEENSIIKVSDEEGYINIDLKIMSNQADIHSWKSIFITSQDNIFRGEIMMPSCNPEYGIISDIDDTLLVTDVHSPLKMAINSLFKNSYQRIPFDGMHPFYKNLSKEGINPVFYLSNSPWNLYKNIEQFLDINNMPKGPILLRDYGFHFPKAPKSYINHKEINIQLIMSVFKDLGFILIGDATQEDALIYSRIKRKYPGRIKQIYIKEVNDHRKIKDLRTEKQILNNKIIYFKNYYELLKDH